MKNPNNYSQSSQTNTEDHLSDFVAEPVANSRESSEESNATNLIKSRGSSPKQGIFWKPKMYPEAIRKG